MPLVGPAAGLHIPRKKAVAHPASPSMLKCYTSCSWPELSWVNPGGNDTIGGGYNVCCMGRRALSQSSLSSRPKI